MKPAAEGHVSFAVAEDDTRFFVFGANQPDAVTIDHILAPGAMSYRTVVTTATARWRSR